MKRTLFSIYRMLAGLSTYVFSKRRVIQDLGGSTSARYCYSVFLRHLVLLHERGVFKEIPKIVAELGPGDSIGFGLAAILAGAKEYIGLDIQAYNLPARTLIIFDELVKLFQTRAPIPDDSEFPEVKPKLKDYAFPDQLLPDALLAQTLAPSRLEAIRALLTGEKQDSNIRIRYEVPWYETEVSVTQKVDWIFSQAVLEHVDDLETTYEAMHQWLKPNGFMSHQIDFRSHGLALDWNGHWAYSPFVWKLIRGAKTYLLNRQPLSTHLTLLKKNAFKIKQILSNKREDGLPTEKLSKEYLHLPREDYVTAGAFVIAELDKSIKSTQT